MRQREKAFVACALVLIALALGAAVLYWTGWGTILKNAVVLGSRGNSLVSLAKKTPFAPPEDGRVATARLEAYLRVCSRIQPLGDKIDAWERSHAEGRTPGRGEFKGAAAGLVGDFLREFEAALREEAMGPAEFTWIARRTETAPEALPKPYLFRERLEASALGPHARKIAEGFAD